MLRCQNLRRSHQRHLVPVLDGNHRRLERHDGLPRPHVTLQQPTHRCRLLHVIDNLFQHALLRRRRMKRQNLLHCRARLVVDREAHARLRPHLAPFQLQAKFEKKQFLKDQTKQRWSPRRLQLRQALAHHGPMRLPERGLAIHEPHLPAYHRRNRIRQILVQPFQHPVNDAPEPSRRQLPFSGRLINGNNAPRLQRLPLSLLFICRRAAPDRVIQNFKLRLHDLQPVNSSRRRLHLSVQRHNLSRPKLIFQIGRVEPDALQCVASLAHRQLKQRHASRAKQSRRAHLGDHARHLSGAQLADAPRIQPVFIAKRQVVEQVFDRRDALLQQHLGNARPNALHILHVGRQFQHSAMVNQCGCQ